MKEYFYTVFSGDETSEAGIHQYADETEASLEMSKGLMGLRIVGWEQAHMDEWIKVSNQPSEEDIEEWCAPLTIDQVTVRRPGTHPGGNAYWVEPSVTVYYPIIEEVDDE
jgi:hypothetical protein